ncbi:SDR family NAD(P)-dependent oxidoreductase [Ammoniphilus resinae]|uniref:NAD(P)-dependent dehydrogenase (Short-subunit alcohol dehydrogenase family) n=1 Tax=Ammoniphilus resinae TaxID=861532 RepID=A0ABS4GW37_9BACL|nr:glucose 1-dehydrogenase [Ammoniphilus resinae]MBP1934466.1 NAD(P)-dependent dehydrogenase (short-subunit alcohol dehydrogenase family) [Ammoniphilus resinae]
MELQGKIALVTGAGGGIGRASAIKLAEAGASVVLAGNVLEGLEELKSFLIDKGLNQVHILQIDVTKEEDAKAAVQAAVEQFGGLDILVNSAGIQRYGTVVDTPIETWDEVFHVNVRGMYLLSKYAIPEMQKRKGGSIVHISSVQAFASQKSVAAYTASKGAVNALTRAMALDHAADQIRVNTVCPGSVDTPMLRWSAGLFGDEEVEATLNSWGKMHPLGRIAKAEEVAEMVLFLSGPRAGFVTGGEYKVDGGLTAALGVALPE